MADALASHVAEARRRAGLTEKELAERLGISLFQMERLEREDADAGPHFDALQQHLGALQPRAANVRRTQDEPPASEPAQHDRSAALGWGGLLVLFSIAALVLVRFFTETLGVLPRILNFADIPIVLALSVAAGLSGKVAPSTDAFSRSLLPLGAGFLIIATAGILMNSARVELAPALVFVYGVLSPLVVYRSVQILWPVGRSKVASRWLVGLGVIQLAVGYLVSLPRFLSIDDPDVISGTFGTNPYQFVFFMVLFVSLMAGVYSFERGRTAARFAPLMIGASLVLIVLAQYRAFLLTTGFALVMVAIVVSNAPGRTRGVVAASVAVMALMAALAFGADKFPILKLDRTLEQNPTAVLEKRYEVLTSVTELYGENPRYLLTGTGPGTFSSRGWQTFALSDSTSPSNVQGSYAQQFTGGEVYRTDVSDRYVQPLLTSGNRVAFAGSTAASSPYSSYSSVAAEAGILGLLLLIGIYFGALRAVLRRVRNATRSARPNDPLPALLLFAGVGFFALIQMALLENWLEVTRVTFVTWAVFAIAAKEFDARSPEAAT